jgi:hypothetical protein
MPFTTAAAENTAASLHWSGRRHPPAERLRTQRPAPQGAVAGALSTLEWMEQPTAPADDGDGAASEGMR